VTDGHDTHGDAHTSWEQRYAESERIWSGRVNARLAEVADGLAPGRALDLGAGEGADAIWLPSTSPKPRWPAAPRTPGHWPSASNSSSTT
jgi:hypothetical protein